MLNSSHHFVSNFTVENKLLKITDTDFWQDLFEDSYLNWVIGPAAIFSVFFLILGFIGLFRFIAFRPIKTVLSHCDRIIYSYAFGFLCIPFSIDVIRIYSGPMPQWICWWYKFFKNFTPLGCQFGFIIAILSRYFTIVKKFNLLGCNDEFFNIFLNVFVFMASFIIALLHNMVPGKMGINYFICTGEDPDKYHFLKPKFPVSGLLPPITLLVFASVSIRLFVLRKSFALDESKAQKPAKGADTGAKHGIFPVVNNFARSLLDLLPLYSSMIFVVTDSIVWSTTASKMSPLQIIHTIEGKMYIFSHHYFTGLIALWHPILLSYWRKPELRQFVQDEARELYSRLKIRHRKTAPAIEDPGQNPQEFELQEVANTENVG